MRYRILALFLVLSGLLHAYDVEVDGIYYGTIGSRWAYVTYPDQGTMEDGQWPTAYVGDVVVPSQIDYNGHTYTVMSVGECAFAGQDSLISVQLPSTVRALSACAFLGCTSLREVSLPADIQAVSSCAFTGCTSLQQITLPHYAELVDTLTLYCCASMTSVALPQSIRKVCQGALEHLPALTDLYCFAMTPPLAEPGAFTLADQQHSTLHVPAKALPKYQESPVWSEFHHIVPLLDDDYIRQNYRRGDINDDGKIDAEDFALLRRLIVGLPNDAAVPWAADVNGDGIVNALDYVMLIGEQ